ncbi:MAG: SMC-Scp complex subunit ScpB [Gammaproteobacteria bacterium]|nr:SMC-Scp complex subunit ScpB [Gammaproteobacteria bacterium]MBT8444052.1 SMC-Scp complex subunit ScpB [Gammaproteobacteria bacterium]
MDSTQLKYVVEAALLAAGKPLNLDKLQSLFSGKEPPARQDIRAAIMDLQADFAERGIELVEVGSGFRIQIRTAMTHQLEKLWEERPPRYSRALLETMSIIAYRQPVTRGEIEDIRGVAVSTNIVRTLLERNWIKVVGHRDVPGKPAMFGTTREFLDYFGLKKLDDLPPLSELKDFENLNVQLDLAEGEIPPVESAGSEAGSESEQPRDLAEAFGPEDSVDDVAQEIADSDNVASLDEARAAAQAEDGDEAGAAHAALESESESATVLPLKQP